MKRAGKKKKDSNKSMRMRISREAINYMATMTETILRSEFGFDNDQIARFVDAVNRYSGFIARDDIEMGYSDFVKYNKDKRGEP